MMVSEWLERSGSLFCPRVRDSTISNLKLTQKFIKATNLQFFGLVLLILSKVESR